eukprot:365800-Chlamydomonas_euryale.AAC.8
MTPAQQEQRRGASGSHTAAWQGGDGVMVVGGSGIVARAGKNVWKSQHAKTSHRWRGFRRPQRWPARVQRSGKKICIAEAVVVKGGLTCKRGDATMATVVLV